MISARSFIYEEGKEDSTDKKSESSDDSTEKDVSIDDINFDSESDASSEEDKDSDNFDKLVSNINNIKFARNFDNEITNIDLNSYISEFIGQTKNKSLLLGIINNETLISNILEIIQYNISVSDNTKVVLIFSDILNAKDIVNSKDSSQFIIANYLKSKIKNLAFDVWFDVSTFIINDVIKRTNRSIDEVYAAIYCMLKLRRANSSIINKFETESVLNLLKYYGVDKNSIKSIDTFIFPEKMENSQNAISYIVKMFDHVLMVNLLNKVIQYEKSNYICIVLTNMNIAYKLKNTFKKLYNSSKS